MFNVINMTFPAEKQIVRIFGTMLNQQLLDFHEEVKGLGKELHRLAQFFIFNFYFLITYSILCKHEIL